MPSASSDGSQAAPTVLVVVFTRQDILEFAPAAREGTHAIVYHGMPRDPVLEAEVPHLFFAMDFLDLDKLSEARAALRAAIGDDPEGGPLCHFQNNLIQGAVQFISILAAAMAAMASRYRITEVKIVGFEAPHYFPMQEGEGETYRRIEWFPEYFYPQYAEQLASSLNLAFIRLPSKKRRFAARLRIAFRPWLLDVAKAALLIRRQVKLFGLSALRPSIRLDGPIPGPVDTIVMVRSHAGVDQLKNYCAWQSALGRRTILLVGEQMLRIGVLDYVQQEIPSLDVVYLPKALTVSKIVLETLRSHFMPPARKPLGRCEIGYGQARFTLDLDVIANELDNSTSDHRLYQAEVSAALDSVPEGRRLCLSAEMISFQASVEAYQALRRGLQYWNTEHDPTEKRNVLRLAAGTGYALQTIQGLREARTAMPWEAHRLHHFGCLSYPWVQLRPSKPRDSLRTVVYYTQPPPLNEEHNRLIADELATLADQLDFKLVVKPHPRDFFDYSTRWQSPRIRVASRLGERSVQLTDAADCVVSRFSSTLMEALYLGVPYIAVLLDHQTRLPRLESTTKELGVRHESIEDMLSSLRQFGAYAAGYYVAREKFLRDSLGIPMREIAVGVAGYHP